MNKTTLVCYFLFVSLSLSAQTWETFTATADSLDLETQFETSLLYREKALEAAKNKPDSIQKMLLGLHLFTQAEYTFSLTKKTNQEAYSMMQHAVDILQKANAGPERMSKVYWDLNLAAFNYMSNQQDTEKFLNKSIEYHLKSPKIDTLLLLNTIHGSGYMAILSGKYDKSIETLERGISLFDQYQAKDKDYNLKGYFYSNLALVHHPQFLGIPQKELLYLNQAEKTFASMREPDLEYFIGTYIDLSKNERERRNYESAKGYLNKALHLYESNKEQFHTGTMHYLGFKKELQIYNNLIIIYRDAENLEDMLKIHAKVEAIALNNELDQTEKNIYAGILQSVSRYYLHQEYDFNKAVKLIEKALNITVKRTNIHFGELTMGLHVDMATAYLLKKDYHQALRIIERVEKSNTLQPHHMVIKAQSLLGSNQPEAAIGAINQLLIAISEDNQNFKFPESPVTNFTPSFILSDAEGFVDLAESFRNYYKKHTSGEEKLYWMALAQLESNMGNTPLNKALKHTFDRIISGLMNATLERNFSTTEHTKLLTFIENITSRDLITNFLMKRDVAGNTQLYKLVEQEQYIRSYMTFLKKENQKSEDETIKQQLFEKELELKKINEQLGAEYRQSKLFVVPEIDITATTGKNIIKFTVTKNELFKTRLYNGKLTYKKVADYPALKQDIENYLALINNLETPISTLKKQGGATLYKQLFTDDFDTTLPTVIIPDGILHYLPFELLVKDNRYLIENHTISYASSFYFLTTPNSVKSNSKSTKVAFFAPEYSGKAPAESMLAVRGAPYSLAGAADEVNEIAKFISGNVYLGNSASKAKFKSLEGDISILHLAMHSTLNSEDPELSHLMFSDSEQDYEMYISELYGMNFNSNLAVLSACNTGIGGFQDGGNLVSMHHAFTVAGIPATIASLWDAPDQSTKEIMIAFYKNLQQGYDKATALRLAKLSYLENTNDENLQHPFYWAGFVLSGDESPIQLMATSSWEASTITVVLSIIFLLIFLFLLFFLKRKVNII